MVTKQRLLYPLEFFFETLTDTPNISQGFMFVGFVVLEILGGSISIPPPLSLVGVPNALVPVKLVLTQRNRVSTLEKEVHYKL